MNYLCSHWCLWSLRTADSLVHSALGKDISRGNLIVYKLFFPPSLSSSFISSSLQSLLQIVHGNLDVHYKPRFHLLFISIETQQCSVTCLDTASQKAQY